MSLVGNNTLANQSSPVSPAPSCTRNGCSVHPAAPCALEQPGFAPFRCGSIPQHQFSSPCLDAASSPCTVLDVPQAPEGWGRQPRIFQKNKLTAGEWYWISILRMSHSQHECCVQHSSRAKLPPTCKALCWGIIPGLLGWTCPAADGSA